MSASLPFDPLQPIVFASAAAMVAADTTLIPPGSAVCAVDTGFFMYDPTTQIVDSGVTGYYATDGRGVFIPQTYGALYLNSSNQITGLNNSAAVAVIRYAGKQTNGGGSPTIAITVNGIVTSDEVFAQIESSTNAVSVQKVTPTSNTITVLLSGDPGAGTVISYTAIRAM